MRNCEVLRSFSTSIRLGGRSPLRKPSRVSASASSTTGRYPCSMPAYLRTRASAAGRRSGATCGSSSPRTLPNTSRGTFAYGTSSFSWSSEPLSCRSAASTRMARSCTTFTSRSPPRRPSSVETASRSACRRRSRCPGVKSEIRSSIPTTPVRAASSGVNRARTSSKTCAFRLLRSIQSPFAERCAAGGGAGAACEQPRNRTVAAMCQRMGGAVYAPTPAAQTRPAYFFLTGWRAAAGAFPDCLLPSRITT